MATIREWFKPSDEQLARLKDRAIKEWKTEKEIYEAFVKKWWIDRDEEVENEFRLEQEAKDKADYFDKEMLWWATVDELDEKIEDKFDIWKLSSLPTIAQAMANWISAEWLKSAIAKAAPKIAWTLWTSAKFLARNAWAIASSLISAYQTKNDRESWKIKAEYKWEGDWAWAYLRDVWRNLYWYADNMAFWLLPNIDSVYNNTERERREQAEELKKNKEVKNRKADLKSVDKTFSKIDKNDEMNARQQMNNAAVKNGKVADDSFQADFVKNNEWRTVKKKDWTTVKTGVNKPTKEPVTGVITSSKK